jgi:translation initiation factor IF-2
MIIGFNVKLDPRARDINEELKVPVETFDIIYKITEWLVPELEKRRPRVQTEEILGKAKILKAFSATKEKQVIGGRVTEGKITQGSNVKILRRENEIGSAYIVGLEQSKQKTKEVLEGSECGILIESKIEIAPGDELVAFTMVAK